jgi:hypothetical protein
MRPCAHIHSMLSRVYVCRYEVGLDKLQTTEASVGDTRE